MATWTERRRHPRLEVHGQIVAEALKPRRPVGLVDLSEGGFRVTSDALFPTGIDVTFRFGTPDGSRSTILKARAISSQPGTATGSTGRGQCETRFAFVDAEVASVQQRIHELLDHVVGTLRFD